LRDSTDIRTPTLERSTPKSKWLGNSEWLPCCYHAQNQYLSSAIGSRLFHLPCRRHPVCGPHCHKAALRAGGLPKFVNFEVRKRVRGLEPNAERPPRIGTWSPPQHRKEGIMDVELSRARTESSKKKGGSNGCFLLRTLAEMASRLAERAAGRGGCAGGIDADHATLVRVEVALPGNAHSNRRGSDTVPC